MLKCNRGLCCVVLLAVGLLVAPSAVRAEEAVHPDSKMPSAKIQGEYVGEINVNGGKQKHGVQIIARGDGKYEGVAYEGGLPGAGWNREQPRRYQGRQTDEYDALFETDKFNAQVRDGAITVFDADGGEVGKLPRVERASDTLGAKPPEGAVVLFALDGANDFENARIQEGLGLREGVTSKTKFGDGTLHLEFMLPLQPKDTGQKRGNSGVYLQGRYEVQVLDSFGLEGRDNECGGIYGIKAPDVNMCLPPLQWQTYDIDFTAARYEDGQQVAAPRISVRHNGVVIHDDVELPKTTTASPVKAGPQPGPLYLQNHGNMLVFRNVWFMPKE